MGVYDDKLLSEASKPDGFRAKIDRYVKKGASLKARDQEGNTALLKAAMSGNIKMVDHLLQQYAKEVSLIEKNNNGNTTLLLVVWNGQIAMLDHLLARYPEKVSLAEKDNNGETALLKAARSGQIAMLDHLLARYPKEASLAEKTNNGTTALLYAAWNGQIAMLDHLLARYPEKVSLAEKTNDDRTALLFAALNGKSEMVKHLLLSYSKEIDVFAKDIAGETALDYAKERSALSSQENKKENQEIIALLTEAMKKKPQEAPILVDEPLEKNSWVGQSVKALYSFTARYAEEISFKEGDVLRVISIVDEQRLNCDLNGIFGYIPANSVELISIEEAERLKRNRRDSALRAIRNPNINQTKQLKISSLLVAVQATNFAAIREMKGVIDINWLELYINKNNVFHLALKRDDINLFSLLLEVVPQDKQKILLRGKNNQGNMPLHLAVSYNEPEVVKKILNVLDADARLVLGEMNNEKCMPLHIAVSTGRKDNAAVLINAGANEAIYLCQDKNEAVFKARDVLKVISMVRRNALNCELNGLRNEVPLQHVQLLAPVIRSEKHKITSEQRASFNPKNYVAGGKKKLEGRYAKACYDFDAFKAGDILKVIAVSGNWWRCELNSQQGLIPANYCQLLSEDESVVVQKKENQSGASVTLQPIKKTNKQEDKPTNKDFVKGQNFGRSSSFSPHRSERFPASKFFSLALRNYREVRENASLEDNPQDIFPSRGFERLNMMTVDPRQWPDLEGRYWWIEGSVEDNDFFYWKKDEGRGYPDKNEKNRYWFIVGHSQGDIIEGFSSEPDYDRGFPDRKGNYWRYIQYTECGAIKAWMEEKDKNYLVRLKRESNSLPTENQPGASPSFRPPSRGEEMMRHSVAMKEAEDAERVKRQAQEKQPSEALAAKKAQVLYDYAPQDSNQLVLRCSEVITVLQENVNDWSYCQNSQGDQGYVPANYLTPWQSNSAGKSTPSPQRTPNRRYNSGSYEEGEGSTPKQPSKSDSRSSRVGLDEKGQGNVDLIIPNSDLTLGQELGKGTFGAVYQGDWHGTRVAIKKLLEQKLNRDVENDFLHEAGLMMQLQHENVVRLYGVSLKPYGMVLEFMAKGSLDRVLHSAEPLSWQCRYTISLDVAKGLAFLHRKLVLHRDLKSLNVLLDEQYKAKLGDFGLSKIKTSSSQTYNAKIAGTLKWIAPELLNDAKERFTQACDVYSYGMLLWELLSREKPYRWMEKDVLVYSYVGMQGRREDIPQNAPAILSTLTTQCWSQETSERPSMAAVVKALQETPVTDKSPQPSSHAKAVPPAQTPQNRIGQRSGYQPSLPAGGLPTPPGQYAQGGGYGPSQQFFHPPQPPLPPRNPQSGYGYQPPFPGGGYSPPQNNNNAGGYGSGYENSGYGNKSHGKG